MADNITAPGVGTVFASDDISGVQYPRTKIAWGVDGSAVDTSASNPLPVTLGLTDTQLRASAVAVSFTGQSVGITGSVAVTGTFWQATQPVSIASAVTVTPPTNATTTRAYDFTNGQRIASGATSARSTAVAASEIMLHASARCFVRIGDDTVAATAGAGSFPLEIGEKFHCRLTSGQFVAVIRDTADGFLTVMPVA